MKKQKDRPDEDLRKRAEKSLLQEGRPDDIEVAHMKKLLHESGVHRIELEMQNEELKKAQNVTEESRLRYAGLYDFAPVGYFTFDRSGLIKEVNFTGAEMIGMDREQLIDRPFAIFMDEEMRDVFSTHYHEVLRTGNKLCCELALKNRMGAVLWVVMESMSGPPDSASAAVLSVLLDITDKKRAEASLREANAKLKKAVMEQKRTADALVRFEAATEQAREALMITDQNWNIEYANRAASTLTGYEREELVGMNALALRDSIGGPIPTGGLLPPVSECGVCSGEYTIRRKDGTTVRVEGDSTMVEKKDGSGHDCVLVLHDITERTRMERELRQSQKMEAIGTFAAGIAHDFNNILAGIIGFSEMVLEDTDPTDPRHKKLSLVLKGANRGRDLARQILAFGRSVEPSRRPLSLGGTIWEAYKLLRPSVPSTIDISISIKTESDTILGDQTLLQQVLMNLGSNAFYAMREKGGSLEITLAEVGAEWEDYERLQKIRPGNWVGLTVQDRGCGMTPEVIDRIFDPFFTTKGPGEGTGMGLSVVHGIVRDHGGDIRVESRPGTGSTFHLSFPRIAASVADENDRDAAVLHGKASILFVDDEEMLVEMNSVRLGRLGYKVTATTSSPEALKIFNDDPAAFDLLITDYTMPYMTGIELVEKILRIRKDFPVILCTGVDDEPVVNTARVAGIGGFLPKPFGVREIASLIAKLLPPEKSS